MARDARGREIVLGTQALPSGGCDLALTIDAPLQAQAEDELEKAVTRSGAKGGMVLVQDPSTGELLALAANPGFNPNDLGRVPVSRLSGPAVAAYFEPGSIFKLFTLAAALEAGQVGPDDRVFCERGALTVADRVIHDHETEGYGWLTVAEVFSNSSNIGMAKIGEKIGRGTLYRIARDFGFGTRTGVALPGETAGRLKSPSARDWYGTTTAMMSFGQEIGATALQIVTAYSAVANGGTLYEPLVIREIRGRDGRVVQRGSPSVVRRVIRPGTAATLRAMLEKVVQDGTGQKARVPGYRVAGKTGTAQKLEPGKGVRAYSSTRYTASFCGFIPAE
ncbi:MAG: penicillin-binding protein 2, partial [bacterium]